MNPVLNENPFVWFYIVGFFALIYATTEIVKCVKHNKKARIAREKIMQEFENRYSRKEN